MGRTDDAVGHGAVYGLRYSGASFGNGVPGIFGVALAPIGVAALYAAVGTASISAYAVALCTFGVACYALAEETFRKGTDANEERLVVAERRGRI